MTSKINHVCKKCGDLLITLEDLAAHPERCPQEIADTQEQRRDVSGPDSSVVKPSHLAPDEDEAVLDELIAHASVPSLASLFQRGKQSGLIQAGTEYH